MGAVVCGCVGLGDLPACWSLTMTDKCTPEEARKIVEDENAKRGLAPHTDPASGIVMTPDKGDPSVLTYDPEDVEYDDEVKKRAAKERKAQDKS